MYLVVYLIVCVVMSLATLGFYASDKKKAIKKQWRIPEKVLLTLSAVFGSIGGLIGLYVLRHKNKHWYFVVVNWAALILHIAIGVVVFVLM